MPLQVLKELYHSDSRGDEIQQLSGAVTVTDTCINYMIDSVLIKTCILIRQFLFLIQRENPKSLFKDKAINQNLDIAKNDKSLKKGFSRNDGSLSIGDDNDKAILLIHRELFWTDSDIVQFTADIIVDGNN